MVARRGGQPLLTLCPSLMNRGEAEHFILETQLFLLEPVEQDIVGVGPLLLGVDLSLESGMLGCECLDVCLVHCVIPFPGK